MVSANASPARSTRKENIVQVTTAPIDRPYALVIRKTDMLLVVKAGSQSSDAVQLLASLLLPV